MHKGALDIHTVCECNKYLGQKTLHPQAGVVDLKRTDFCKGPVTFEFYAILLIRKYDAECQCQCGRMHYDYAYSTMVFLAPGTAFSISPDEPLPVGGRLLTFHPDLVECASLSTDFHDYPFFAYRQEEALHLSKRETEIVDCCLDHINEELHHAIDIYTATILSRHIELLLDYSRRFYRRQFITRDNENRLFMEKIVRLMDDYLADNPSLAPSATPQTAVFADALGLSDAYFNDLMLFLTGLSLEEYFEHQRLERAKTLLLKTHLTPTEVAHRLRYNGVQQFSYIFKKLTGIAPSDYRTAHN